MTSVIRLTTAGTQDPDTVAVDTETAPTEVTGGWDTAAHDVPSLAEQRTRRRYLRGLAADLRHGGAA